MPELALDDDERNAFVCHFNRVRVTELVRSESSPDARCFGGSTHLLAGGGLLPMPAGGRTVDHAEQRTNRQPTPDLHPRIRAETMPNGPSRPPGGDLPYPGGPALRRGRDRGRFRRDQAPRRSVDQRARERR